MHSNDPMEKDAAEEELERAVFGDDIGFREALKAHAGADPAAQESDGDVNDDGNEGDLDGVDDADVRS